MKKITLFFMSMFFVLGTTMAKDEESAEFALQYMTPQDGAKVTSVYNVILGFSKDVTVTLPEEGIDIVNNETKDVVKITRIYSDEWSPKNQVQFLFEQEMAEGKEGKEELRDKIIETPGTYSYTIPAGVIKSVDGEEFPETTFTFSIVGTFSLTGYSPRETTSLEKIELTFDKEITEVKMPNGGLVVTDFYWSQFFNIKNEVTISDDKKTVTLELETPITTPGQYFMDLYQGVFISADAISNGASLSFNIIDPTPSYETNYKDGDKVKELGNIFEITFKNVKEVNLIENTFYLYLPGGGEAEGTASLKDNKITVTFDQEFTEEGEYVFHVPAGAFTMDGVANEESMVTITLKTAEITPLEILSVTPEVGTVDQIEKIVIQFNQPIQLSFDENWQQISREITLTCGDQKITLTYAPDYSASTSDKLTYLPNAQWNGYDGYNTTPITADGTYTLDLSSIVIDYGAEEGIDEYGYPATIWNAKKYACEGTYTWVIGSGESAIEAINAESGKKAIYDILGRRIDKVTGPGIYIVNGKKVILK